MTAPSDNTPASIIEDAYFDAGILQEGQSPNSEQLVSGMRRLTDMINFWQTQGLKLWLNVDIPVPLTAGRSTYTLGPAGSQVMTKPLRVVEAYYQQTAPLAATAMSIGTTYVILTVGTTDFTLYGASVSAAGTVFTATGVGLGTGTVSSSNVRRPLIQLSWNDYVRLSQTSNAGAVNSYFIDKQQGVLSVFFWLTPDSTAATQGLCNLVLQTQVTNFISVTETMNFPIEWKLALHWGLADQICTGQPQSIMDRCQQRAETYRNMLEDWDVEDAPTRFTPDPRGGMTTGKFR